MSQDGSSSKSYIKHPTEKARLEGLAFTSFPEDYLPYTSPSYQRKAPYLIWDQQQPYGVLRPNRSEQLRRFCCSTSALVAAVVLLIAAILAIVAVSVYLGVITNLFRSPIFSISARLRVLEGDLFDDVLLNQTSEEFSIKAEYYRALVESLLLSSSLQPAFVAARVYAFRQGSVLVFFRVHLDRRKLVHDDKEVLLIMKSLLMEQAMSSPSSSFDNLILDLQSIDVREYGEEEWFADDGDDELVSFEGADNLLQNKSVHSITSSPSSIDEPTEVFTESSHVPTKDNTISSTQSSTQKDSATTRTVLLTVRKTEAPRVIHLRNSSAVRKTSTTPSTNGQGSVRYGYAEWHPIDLPPAIQVATLTDSQAPKKDQRNRNGVGSVKPVSNDGSIPVMDRMPSIVVPNVAPTIMSSVSLVIRPSSRNRSTSVQKDSTRFGSGIVKPVSLERGPDRILPVAEIERKARIDDVPFSSIEESDGKEPQLDPKVSANEFTQTPSPDYQSNSSGSQTESMGEVLDAEVAKTTDLSFHTSESSDPLLQILTTSELVKSSIKSATTEELADQSESFEKTTDEIWEELKQTTSHISLVPNEETSTDVHLEFETTALPENLDPGTTGTFSEVSLLTVQDGSTATETSLESQDLDSSEETSSSLYSSLPTAIAIIHEGQTGLGSTGPPVQNDPVENATTLFDHSSTEESIQTLQKSRKEEVGSTNQSVAVLDGNSETTSVHGSAVFPDVTAALSMSLKNFKSENDSSMDGPPETFTVVSDTISRINVTYLEDLQRFRKIVQPFSQISPNDINSGDDLKHPIFTFNNGFPSTLATAPPTLSDDQDIRTESDESKIADNSTSDSDISRKSENQSSIVGFGKNPIFTSHRCTEDEMFCGSGECVPTNYRCNMRRDCRDNSDEENCTCSEYLAVVGQSQKICDGIKDCWDSSDEYNCPWCSPDQFLCPQAKFCINMSQVCDGSNDCPFGTDERYCVKLAQDEVSASSADYHSEGYLMVRKSGKWGKLCLDTMRESARSDMMKLEELGRAVCSALTYRELKEATKVKDQHDMKSSYYEIKSHPLQHPQHRSTAIFKPSTCKSQDVVHVKCSSLECGLRPMAISSSRRRIVGGQSTGSGSWPWQVALYKEGDFQCGAVLISDSWLLSAGHCFYSTQTAYWTARLGILRRGTELPSPVEKVRRIRKIILHPEYIDKGFINDIALLLLDEPVPFSNYLRPLCLPTPAEDVRLWHGQHCSVVGWGKLFEIGHTFPDSLQEVRLPVISTEECRKRIVFLSMYHITDNMFCAGFERGGRDACLGDSGGPLMCQRQDGRWVLLGITSNGDGCGRPGRPGVYTKVTQYLEWIDRTMRSHNKYPNTSQTCLGRRCSLGRCVQSYKICDGRFDCTDGSDEASCPVSPI